jgi:hypothetical protein
MTVHTPIDAAEFSTRPKPLTQRVWVVVRLLFANPWTAIYTPLLILSFILLVNIAIWGVLRATIEGASGTESSINGGAFFLFIYMLVVAVQSVNQAFPLALGYGSTRRDFLLGFAVFALIVSVGYSLLLAAAGALERATDNWGVGLTFFSTSALWQSDWWQPFIVSVLAFLLFFGIGAATAAVYVRWRAMGMYVFWAALVVLLLGGAGLVTWLQAWPHVGAFFAVSGVIGTAAWTLVLTGFCALAAWLILRRATPVQG